MTRLERIAYRTYATAISVSIVAFIVAVAASELFGAPTVARVAAITSGYGVAVCFLVAVLAMLRTAWGEP